MSDSVRANSNFLHRALYNTLLKKHLGRDCKLENQISNKGATAEVFSLKYNPNPDNARVNGELQSFAVKIIDLQLLDPEYRESFGDRAFKEINLMMDLKDCPYTSKLQTHFVVKANELPALSRPDGFRDNDPVLFFLVMPQYKTYPNNKSLLQEEVIQLGIEICNALTALNDLDLIHRDVKPSNIFIEEDAHGKKHLLGDLGISRITPVDTSTGLCTERYYPTVDWRESERRKNADIYSVAVTMARFLGGIWRKRDIDREYQGVCGYLDWQNFVARRLCCPALRDILRNGLVGYEQRYQTPSEMQADLKLLQDYWKREGRFSDTMTLEELREEMNQAVSLDQESRIITALMNKDFQLAADLSREGHHDKENLRCSALLAYSSLHLIRLGKLGSSERKKIEKLLSRCSERLEIAALDTKDLTQKDHLNRQAGAVTFLLAVSRYEDGDHKGFLKHAQNAAELGSPMACYVCGRGMYTGDAPFEKQEGNGWNYLLQAADAGYGAAMAYVLREMQSDSFLRVPPQLRTKLLNAGTSNPRHRMEDILREF